MGKKAVLISIIIVLSLAGFWLLTKGNKTSVSPQAGEQSENHLTSVDSITHAHGLAVDVGDSNKVYIATHNGLLVLNNGKNLFRVGKSQDDFMGFSPHPSTANILYSSGHPRIGGNIGVQKSEDSGVTWKRISGGAGGPVDFHAMTVSLANPEVMYGWYQGRLQRSTDGGNNWQVVNSNITNIISLATDPQDENIIYAATDQSLQKSSDQGENWTSVSPDLDGGAIVALAVNPDNPQEILTFSQKMGVAKSNNSGSTWEKLSETFGGDLVLYFAYDKQNPNILYALTKNNVIYKSMDSGSTWIKVY